MPTAAVLRQLADKRHQAGIANPAHPACIDKDDPAALNGAR